MTTNGTNQGATPPAGGETSNAGQQQPQFVSQKDLDSWGSKFAGKFNGEIASLRKSVETFVGKGGTPESGGNGGAEQPAKSNSGAQSNFVTHEDLKFHRELGRLEAQAGDDLIAQLGDEYGSLTPAQQVQMLKMAIKIRGGRDGQAGDGTRSDATSTEARGETPAKTKQTPRAAAPASRDSVPRPTTRREYIALDKRTRDLLSKDPDFDPSELAP